MATSGDITLTSDTIAILARRRSFDGGGAHPRGHPLQQPLTVDGSIGIATGAIGTFNGSFT